MELFNIMESRAGKDANEPVQAVTSCDIFGRVSFSLKVFRICEKLLVVFLRSRTGVWSRHRRVLLSLPWRKDGSFETHWFSKWRYITGVQARLQKRSEGPVGLPRGELVTRVLACVWTLISRRGICGCVWKTVGAYIWKEEIALSIVLSLSLL